MDIIFYKITDEKIVVNKNIQKSFPTSILIKWNLDRISPQFVLSQNIDKDFNYCYVPMFKRYYYINEIIENVGGFFTIQCTCDVLMSWKNQLMNCTGIIEASQNFGNPYLNGNQYMNQLSQYSRIFQFENGFDEQAEYILITAGGWIYEQHHRYNRVI